MPAQELMDITCLRMEDDLETSRHQLQGILCLLWEDTILALPLQSSLGAEPAEPGGFRLLLGVFSTVILVPTAM